MLLAINVPLCAIRCGLRVVLPIPEHVYSLLPTTNAQQPNDPPTFCVTPVLFNIGINEEVRQLCVVL